MFSKDSRWDRHTPEEEREEAPIDVAALFRGGQIFPKSFLWQGRRHEIKETTYHWAEKRGSDILHYYSVTDGTDLFQIYLNTTHLTWRLVKSCSLEGGEKE